MIPVHPFEPGPRAHLCRVCDGLRGDPRHVEAASSPGPAPDAGELAGAAVTLTEERADTGDSSRTTGDTPPDTPVNTADESDTADEAGPDSEVTAGDTPEDSSESEAAGELTGDALEPGAGPHRRGAQAGWRYYDWDGIRRRYVEGHVDDKRGLIYESLDTVAEAFNVVPSRVREKAAMEGWRAQQQQWRARLEAERQAAKIERMLKDAEGHDQRALDAAKMGLQLCMAKLTEIGQQAQARRSAGGPGASSGDTIDALEMNRLAQAVDLWHKIGLRAIGDPETHRVELTGANGRPLEIAAELRRDDPNRLAGVLSVLAQAGVGELFGGESAARRTLADHGRAARGEPAELTRG